MSTYGKAIVYSCALLRKFINKSGERDAVFLSLSTDVSSTPIAFRSKAAELIRFISRTTASSVDVQPDVPLHARASDIENMDYFVHARFTKDGLVAVIITNEVYSNRIANVCLQKLLEAGSGQLPPHWKTVEVDQLPVVKKTVQDGGLLPLDRVRVEISAPENMDKLAALQKTALEVREICLDNVEKAMANGRKMDDLLADTEDLSRVAKNFYTEARKLKRCRMGCTVM